MDGEEALQQIETLLSHQGESLGYPKRAIFLGAWQGLSYEAMILTWDREYDHSYIKAQGAELCRLLSRLLGLKVTKPTFRQAVGDGLRQWQAQVNQGNSPPICPCESGPPTSDRPPYISQLDGQEIRWVERGTIVPTLIQKLQQDCRLLFIVGLTGIGKTSLATRLLVDETLNQQLPDPVAIVLDPTSKNFETLVHKLLDDHLLQEETIQQQPDQIIARLLQRLTEQPTLVVLDMLEEVLQADGQGGYQFMEPLLATLLVKFLKAEEMPSRIILTSQDRPPTLAEGRYEGRIHWEKLSGLTIDQALQLFEQWGILATTEEEQVILQHTIQVYEGHPLALRVIAGEMGEDYEGSILDYWHEYRQELQADQPVPPLDCYSPSLADKVKTRIERTVDRLHQTEPLAYRLLCMAAKMRIPTEREAWLFLLCDYPREEAIWAFQTLQRRFLVEVESNSTRRLYRLHSLIRRIASAHLQQHP